MRTVTVSQWGNSCAIRLDRTLLAQAGIGKGSKLAVRISDGRLILTPTRPEIHASDLDSLFADYHGDYRGEELHTGNPAGEELI